MDEHDADLEEKLRTFSDFDCPDCNANNPVDEPFGNGDEIRCYYCGAGFDVTVSEGGRLRLRPE